jgi:hypothetical protein
MKVERKRLFGVSVKTSGVGYAVDVGWWHTYVLHSIFLFEGPQLCLISISSIMKFSIYFRYISVSELHVL